MNTVKLISGREKSVQRRHPWLLSGAVDRVEGSVAPGDWVRVVSSRGELLGHGLYSAASSIRVRLLCFGDTLPEDDWLSRRIERAVALRSSWPQLAHTDAVRLVNAEGDGLPGLVIDRFARGSVLKLTTVGMARRRAEIASALRACTDLDFAYERADRQAARREDFDPREGALFGQPPGGRVRICEGERRYQVDVIRGQKTGFYLDQRDARALVESLAAGRRVLDLFSFSGGFAVAAAHGGARSVVLVDSSKGALECAEDNLRENAPDCPREILATDAFEYVRDAVAHPGEFDLLIVDPPPLSRHRGDVPRASRAYKDLLLHALRRAAPGALLLAFSCSHHVGPDLFRKIAFGAALDAPRDVRVLAQLQAPVDHPVSLAHPEGQYLSGLLLQV